MENNEHLDEVTEESDPEDVANICLPDPPVHSSKSSADNKRIEGLNKTTDLCFSLIHDALLKNQWQRAADFLISYFQTLESNTRQRVARAPELIWRLGNETLLHHPKATPEDISFFNERMKNIGVKNYLSISLEHVFYLLCNDMTEEAYRNLSMVESWRYGSLSVSQEKYIKLIQAYRALLDYHKWLDKKAGVIDQDFASQASADQNLSSLYRQATASFQEIIKVPGVWDPFVLGYVDLLESSGKHKQAEELLTDYAYNSKYPSNPNAHVYLYEFLKRNEASEDNLIKVLKVFYLQVPSHKLMLEFVKLLEQSESEEHNQLAVEVIFNILDFSGWKSEVNAWHCLVKQLKKSFRRMHKSWILEEWQSRKRWWPAYHFNKFHVKKDWKNDINLAIHKALVAGTLLGQDCRYFAAVCSLGSESPNKNITSMLKFVKHHDSSNPD